MRRLIVCLSLLAAATPVDAQESDAERDAAIFGEAAPAASTDSVVGAEEEAAMFDAAAETSPPPNQPDAEDALFGERSGADLQAASALPDLVDAKDDRLEIGGLAYLRGSYALSQGEDAETAPLRTPALFDLYADARPSERVRIFTRGRFTYDFSIPSSATNATDSFGRPLERETVALDQLWLKFDVARTVYVTAGKQPLKWGSGRFWNPTDFLNPVLRDPLAAFDERLGVTLVKLHVPFESTGMNVYGVVDVDGADSPEEVGGALRAEAVVGTAELALSGGARKGRPRYLGADLSAGIWDFDVRLEAAFRRGDTASYYEGELDLRRMRLPSAVSRKDEWIPQAVAGLEYSFNYSDEDSASLGIEYFYNESGYEDASLYPWLLFQGAYRPLYTGKHYGAVYGFLAGPGSWNDTTIIVSTLGNLNDRSYLSRLDWRVQLMSYLNLDLYLNYHYGRNGEFNFGLDVPPVPLVPQLANGFSSPQPRVDAGVGVRMNL